MLQFKYIEISIYCEVSVGHIHKLLTKATQTFENLRNVRKYLQSLTCSNWYVLFQI